MAIDKEKLALDFKERLDAVFQGKITFSLEDYINKDHKIEFHCNKHGESFVRHPCSVLKSHGCSDCRKKKYKRKTEEDFLEEARGKHGDRFDYSKVELVNYRTKVSIRCKKHNENFMQSPTKHIGSQGGCPSCKLETIAGHHKSNKEEFIKKARNVHGDKYNYDAVEYINCDVQVEIYCPVHHRTFKQTPYSHANVGNGCPICAIELHGGFGRKGIYISDRKSHLYLIEMKDGYNHFLKIGLSVTPLRRWKDLHSKDIEFVKPIMLLEGPANKLSVVENKVLWRSSLSKYCDADWTWEGRTECFFMEDAYKIMGIISDEFEKQQLGG